MLDLQEREPFIEALRPPDGYTLDGAIGTTYSLDLVSLLLAPVAFTLFSLEDREDGRPRLDPTIVLESLRRNADKIAVFCQAGQTYLPAESSPLLAFLEDVVVSVDPGTGGVFHPKIWVLRFSSADSGVRYRLLSASRNLTFDRSWDTAVSLEGPLTGRRTAYARNHPLGDLIAGLPGLATGRSVPDRIREMTAKFEQEVRRVDFEVPQPFESFQFWAGGVGSRAKGPLEQRCDRALVVSPFCTARVLESLVGNPSDHTLVSRPTALACLPGATWDRFTKVAVLSDSAEAEQSADPYDIPATTLTGLHAKIFVFDQGWDATVWTGSANATASAFEKSKSGTQRNIEFLVGLSGPRAKCGVNAVLGPLDGATTLADLITDYPRPEKPADPEPESTILDEAREAITRAGLRVRVRPAEASESFMLECFAPSGTFPIRPGTKTNCWPVSLSPTRAQALALQPGPPTFGPVGLDGITSFMAFEVKQSSDGEAIQFVLNLSIDGVPEGRLERLLKCVLKDPEAVARFIGFLLAEEDDAAALAPMAPPRGTLNSNAGSREAPQTLFEQLVRALHRDPARIDAVERFVNDLSRDPEGLRLLPAGFELIWKPILEARRRPQG